MLREMFPQGRFAPPATELEIAAAEAELGVPFPQQLRDLYLECDGFREDRGNSKYLLSLRNEDSIGSLLHTTRFWWEHWKQHQPHLDFSPYVFFGFSRSDACWGINWQHGDEIIAYDHHMEGAYEVVGSNIAKLYLADYLQDGP